MFQDKIKFQDKNMFQDNIRFQDNTKSEDNRKTIIKYTDNKKDPVIMKYQDKT